MAKFTKYLFGGIVGAGIAMLFTPKKGSEMRQLIKGVRQPAALPSPEETPPAAAPSVSSVSAPEAIDLDTRIEETRQQVEGELSEPYADIKQVTLQEPKPVSFMEETAAAKPPVEEMPEPEAPAEPYTEPEQVAPVEEPEAFEPEAVVPEAVAPPVDEAIEMPPTPEVAETPPVEEPEAVEPEAVVPEAVAPPVDEAIAMPPTPEVAEAPPVEEPEAVEPVDVVEEPAEAPEETPAVAAMETAETDEGDDGWATTDVELPAADTEGEPPVIIDDGSEQEEVPGFYQAASPQPEAPAAMPEDVEETAEEAPSVADEVIAEKEEEADMDFLATPVEGEPEFGEPAVPEPKAEPETSKSSFDREAMRRRIEETRARLKAKAFDAMVQGESFISTEDEDDDAGKDINLDAESEKAIEKTLREDD